MRIETKQQEGYFLQTQWHQETVSRCQKDLCDAIRKLVRQIPPPPPETYKTHPTLELAAKAGRWNVVEALVKGGADPNYSIRKGKNTLLHLMHRAGAKRQLLNLVNLGANPLKAGFYLDLAKSRSYSLARDILEAFSKQISDPRLRRLISRIYSDCLTKVELRSVPRTLETYPEVSQDASALQESLMTCAVPDFRATAKRIATYMILKQVMINQPAYHRASEDITGLLPDKVTIEAEHGTARVILKQAGARTLSRSKRGFSCLVVFKNQAGYKTEQGLNIRSLRGSEAKLERETICIQTLYKERVIQGAGFGRYLGLSRIRGKGTSQKIKPSITMANYPDGDLWPLPGQKKLTPHEVQFATTLMLRSLARLHEKRIAHGDIKPNQFLVRRKDDQLTSVDLIDFDASISTGPDDEATHYGSKFFFPPQLSTWHQADVWALAKTLAMIATGTSDPEYGIENLIAGVQDRNLRLLLLAMTDSERPLSAYEALVTWLELNQNNQKMQECLSTTLSGSLSSHFQADLALENPKIKPLPATEIALDKGHWKILEALVESGSDPNHSTGSRENTLMRVAYNANLDSVVVRLAELGANPFKGGLIFDLLKAGESRLVGQLKQAVLNRTSDPDYRTLLSKIYSGLSQSQHCIESAARPYASDCTSVLAQKLGSSLPQDLAQMATRIALFLDLHHIGDQTLGYYRSSSDVSGLLPDNVNILANQGTTRIIIKEGDYFRPPSDKKKFYISANLPEFSYTYEVRAQKGSVSFKDLQREASVLVKLSKLPIWPRPGIGAYQSVSSIPSKRQGVLNKPSFSMSIYDGSTLWPKASSPSWSAVDMKVIVTWTLIGTTLLHELGVAHGDIKPDQFLPVWNGSELDRVDLIDFNRAHIEDAAATRKASYGHAHFSSTSDENWFEADVWALAKTQLMIALRKSSYHFHLDWSLIKQVPDPIHRKILFDMANPSAPRRSTAMDALKVWLEGHKNDIELRRRLDKNLARYSTNSLELDKLITNWRRA